MSDKPKKPHYVEALKAEVAELKEKLKVLGGPQMAHPDTVVNIMRENGRLMDEVARLKALVSETPADESFNMDLTDEEAAAALQDPQSGDMTPKFALWFIRKHGREKAMETYLTRLQFLPDHVRNALAA